MRTSLKAGHWIVLVRNHNNIYYFDSYGVGVDGELEHIKRGLRYELGEDSKLLTKIIKTIPNRCEFKYNRFDFQSYHKNINTCGKWCVVFVKCIFYGLTLKQFTSRIKALRNKYGYKFDVLISILWDTF